MEKGPSYKTIKRIETIEKMDVRDAAVLRYLDEKHSTRWLCAYWHLNNRTVMRVLRYFGIPIRHGGEAIATQWINNPCRRRETGERLGQINHSMALEGRHVRQGKTKENSELVRRVSEKLKKSSSFLRPSVKKRALTNSLKTRQEHPERMSALRFPITKAEEQLSAYLTQRGLPFLRRQLRGGRYIVDFVIPSLNLIIDCQGRNRFPLSYHRHEAIQSQHERVVYYVRELAEKGIFSNLDEYISKLQLPGSNPSVSGQETMIFGACGNAPFGADTNKFTLERLGVYSNYYTVLTRPPNH